MQQRGSQIGNVGHLRKSYSIKADSFELKKNVINITWKCCGWDFNGTEKDCCQFLAWKKGNHINCRNIGTSGNIFYVHL